MKCAQCRTRYSASDTQPSAGVLFVGYQARGSLGRVIEEGTSPVRIFGDWYPVKADVLSIDGFSAHADREELLEWFESLGGRPRHTYVVHGEESASLALTKTLRDKFDAETTAPELGQSFDLPVS